MPCGYFHKFLWERGFQWEDEEIVERAALGEAHEPSKNTSAWRKRVQK